MKLEKFSLYKLKIIKGEVPEDDFMIEINIVLKCMLVRTKNVPHIKFILCLMLMRNSS